MAAEFLAKRNFFVVELERELLARFLNLVSEECLSDLENLLGDHRQHFDLNTIELIKTSPGTSLGQAGEECVHEVEIDLVRAVEHNTVSGNSFGQILSRLSLTSTGGAGWVSTELNVECTSNRDPALVSQRGNNETGSRTHVLATVVQAGLDLLDLSSIRCNSGVFFVVVTELLHPVECTDSLDFLLLEFFNDVTGVHIGGDQSDNNAAVEFGQVGSHMVNKMLNLLLHAAHPSLQSEGVHLHFTDSLFRVSAPLNLGDSCNNLSWLLKNPLLTTCVSVSLLAVLHSLRNSLLHGVSELTKPLLDINSSGFDRLVQVNDLIFL